MTVTRECDGFCSLLCACAVPVMVPVRVCKLIESNLALNQFVAAVVQQEPLPETAAVVVAELSSDCYSLGTLWARFVAV